MLCAFLGHKPDDDHWCLRCGLRIPTLVDLMERAIKRNKAAMIRSLNTNIFMNTRR